MRVKIGLKDLVNYQQVAAILERDGITAQERHEQLVKFAELKSINLSQTTIDKSLGLTIIYDDSYSNGDLLLSEHHTFEQDLLALSAELGHPPECVSDSILYDDTHPVIHIRGGHYQGGATVYSYPQLKRSLQNETHSDQFDHSLVELGITLSEFSERTGITSEEVARWNEQGYPKWIWYTLKGMREATAQ